MRPTKQWVTWGALAVCVLSACATGGAANHREAARESGAYLSPEQMPRLVEILPPAPKPGAPRYEADRKIYVLSSGLLEGSPRWKQAIHDVNGSVPAMLGNFSCALGVALDPVHAPRLSALLSRLEKDVHQVTDPAKKKFRRLRPFQIDGGPVCQPEEQLTHSFDYPSGHASWGWTVGLVLAQLSPDHATGLLERARTYSESRVVCGAHNYSAIEAGATSAASLMAVLNGSEAFRRELQDARAEVEALRGKLPPVDANRCAAERALLAAPLLPEK
jgi:acid phosphatase (class A)